MPTCFRLKIENQVALLEMSRPDAHNAMNREFWNELPALIDDIDANASARVIVLAADGRHFTSGMDVSVFAGDDVGASGDAVFAERVRHFVRRLQGTFSCLEEARIPVIAAIQGACVGGGVDMISACDVRYASEDAFFQIAEINLAMTADVGTFPRLCKLIPEGWVRELAYTGGRLDAAKAKELGLVNEIFPTREAMITHVMAIAAQIAEKSPLAIAGAKRMINYSRDHAIADTLDYVATWQAGMFSRAHVAEAVSAKAAKRRPNFPDLQPMKRNL